MVKTNFFKKDAVSFTEFGPIGKSRAILVIQEFHKLETLTIRLNFEKGGRFGIFSADS